MMKPATCCISTEVFMLNEEFPIGVSHWYSKPSINQTSIFRMYKSDSFRALDTSVYQIKIWNIRCVSGQCQDGCCKSKIWFVARNSVSPDHVISKQRLPVSHPSWILIGIWQEECSCSLVYLFYYIYTQEIVKLIFKIQQFRFVGICRYVCTWYNL